MNQRQSEVKASLQGTLGIIIFFFLLAGGVFSGIGHSLADTLALFK